MTIQTINPATEEILEEYSEMNSDELELVFQESNSAFREWRALEIQDRADFFKKAAFILRKNKERYAKLITKEMGKPLLAAGGEIDKCAWGCEYFSDHAQDYLSPQFIETDAKKSYVYFEPLGVVLAIMPWNFPFWQVFRFAVPAIMAGNAVLLKHAPNTMGCALALEQLFLEAGFVKGLFRSLIIDVEATSRVIENPIVAAVTLTGSVRAGSAVASRAGRVLKKTVLELGGSDPYIVLQDADLEKAAQICVTARMSNAGQVCISAKRWIVVESVFDSFKDKIIRKMKSYVMGDPFQDGVTLGPMARRDLREILHKQVCDSVSLGARLELGGQMPPGKGWFYPPTVLSNVWKGMPVFDEEVFGPVAALIQVRDEEEAISVANDSKYGLGAGIFSQDLVKAETMSHRIEAGTVAINANVVSDPRLPFGGIKNSGYGRELGSFGIYEFTNVKTIFLKEWS